MINVKTSVFLFILLVFLFIPAHLVEFHEINRFFYRVRCLLSHVDGHLFHFFSHLFFFLNETKSASCIHGVEFSRQGLCFSHLLNEKHSLSCSMHMCCVGMCTCLNTKKLQ